MDSSNVNSHPNVSLKRIVNTIKVDRFPDEFIVLFHGLLYPRNKLCDISKN